MCKSAIYCGGPEHLWKCDCGKFFRGIDEIEKHHRESNPAAQHYMQATDAREGAEKSDEHSGVSA